MRRKYRATWRRGGPAGEPGLALDVSVEESGQSSYMPSPVIGPRSEQTLGRYMSRAVVVHGKFEVSPNGSDEELKRSLQSTISVRLGGAAYVDSLRRLYL